MSKAFSKKITPMCAYCINGLACNNTNVVVCGKKGIMDSTDSCRKFKYDPIGRTPKPIPVVPKFKKENFDI